MLKMLKQSLKRLVSNSSSSTSSVRAGSPIKPRRKKINKYIKNKIYIFKIGCRVFSSKYKLGSKLLELLRLIIDIILTGFIIKYCIDNRNALSYGLATILIMYYFERVVLIIKKPTNKKNDTNN